MCLRVRVSACSLVIILGVACWGIDIVAAEPSTFCRDLAAGFATAPAQLDVRSLATLGACVLTEIEERADATERPTSPSEGAAPSPPPVVVLPPPAPSDATQSPMTHQYGDWPLPATWTESWPSPKPW
jgi:hypothetical protein